MSTIKNLINYYLECMSKEFESGFGEFAKDGKGWGLRYGQLNTLPLTSHNNMPITQDIIRVINRVSQNKNRFSLYLGYPNHLKVFKSKVGNTYYRVEPLFLFKYDINTVLPNSNPVLETSAPILNVESIKSITGLSHNALTNEIYSLYDEIDYDNYSPHSDFVSLITKLANKRIFWNWTDNIDPNKLNTSPIQNLNSAGIYNCAALFAIEKSRFTEGLTTELRDLLKIIDTQGEESLKGSALYDWFYNSISSYDFSDKLLIEPIALNDEQRTAVKKAMQSPLTIIEGPPGTGKSQVVTSIIVNALNNNQNVFFSSKTNNAIEVVINRTNSISNREILVRLGGENSFSRLHDYFNNLINIQINNEDLIRFETIKNDYHQLFEEYETILGKEKEMIDKRNEIDRLEQELEPFRHIYSNEIFAKIGKMDNGVYDQLLAKADTLSKEMTIIDKENFSVIKKVSWLFTKNKYQKKAYDKYQELNEISKYFEQILPVIDLTTIDYASVMNGVKKLNFRISDSKKVKRYYQLLCELSDISSQQIAIKIKNIEERITASSQNFINLWLNVKYNNISDYERQRISEFTTVLNLIIGNANSVDKKTWAKYFGLFNSLNKYIPNLTVTSLAIHNKVPMQKSFFDIVVIDESSACDIASVIPLLYRSKRVVIIGDTNQLNHITNMSKGEDTKLLAKYDLINNHISWSYSVNSILNLALSLKNNPESKIKLLNHHRSHSDIINYCNLNFYNDSLRILTVYDNLKFYNKNTIIRWIDQVGNTVRPSTGGAYNDSEANEVYNQLNNLMVNNYPGSIGVVTPFKHQEIRINNLVNGNSNLKSWLETRSFLCDTAHGFQGDERDLMIFSTVISTNADARTIGFLSSTGNLFNVAISRSKAALIIVGDKNSCLNSGINYLVNFVKYYSDLQAGQRQSISLDSNLHVFQSEWEDVVYKKLVEINIPVAKQRKIDNYFLDLAIELDNGKKLDIEIDGEYYHRNWNGELALRDRLRNKRLIEIGWDIKRFWVYQVRDYLDYCIKQIQSWMTSNK